MGNMHGMRCAADLLGWVLVFLDVLGAVAVVLVFIRRLTSSWAIYRWIAILPCKLWRIPFGRVYGETVEKMFGRYPKDRKADAAAYCDRLIDRQINKARGILPFNSILIAALSLENRRGIEPATQHMLDYLMYPIFAGLFISSLLLLELFWVHWSSLSASAYEDFLSEFLSGMVMARDRSLLLDMSIILSIVCILGFLLAVVGIPLIRWTYTFWGLHGSAGARVCWH